MSMNAGTPYNNSENQKDVRAVQVTINKMSDVSGTVWEAPCKQYCLQPSLEYRKRWRAGDSSLRSVPHTSRGHRKGAVTDGGQMCRGGDECGCQRLSNELIHYDIKDKKLCHQLSTPGRLLPLLIIHPVCKSGIYVSGFSCRLSASFQ